MDISVIVPLYNEEESLIKLYEWIEQVMASNKFSFEVIFINDGSTDRSWQIIESLQQKSSNVRGIKFRNNYGKSPALYCGFRAAQGDVVITMDADLQDSPDEIPGLYTACAFTGHGFGTAPAVGLMLAQMTTGEKTAVDISALGYDRFRPVR